MLFFEVEFLFPIIFYDNNSNFVFYDAEWSETLAGNLIGPGRDNPSNARPIRIVHISRYDFELCFPN